jgi:DNA modification methylase
VPKCKIIAGHCLDTLRSLPKESVQVCVTSPPYFGLRNYGTNPQVWGGVAGCDHSWGEEQPGQRQRWGDPETLSEKQKSNKGAADNVAALERKAGRFCQKCGAWFGELGGESDPLLYIAHLVDVFREVRRVLRPDGVLFLNLGDSMCSNGGSHTTHGKNTALKGTKVHIQNETRGPAPNGCFKAKDRMLIPHRTAIALQEDGWYVRMDVVWRKITGMPSSVQDNVSPIHEYIFILTRQERYFWDRYAVLQPYASSTEAEKRRTYTGRSQKDYDGNGVQDTHEVGKRIVASLEENDGANLKSVWYFGTPNFLASKYGVTDAEHFASYPPELPTICILAATSEYGACKNCGAPYKRLVEQESVSTRNPQSKKYAQIDGNENGTVHRDVESLAHRSIAVNHYHGWQKTCKCETSLVRPCVCLDPFGGTGTTGAVAVRLGRDAILCELGDGSVRIAQARVKSEAGLFNPDPLGEVGSDVSESGFLNTEEPVQEASTPADGASPTPTLIPAPKAAAKRRLGATPSLFGDEG